MSDASSQPPGPKDAAGRLAELQTSLEALMTSQTPELLAQAEALSAKVEEFSAALKEVKSLTSSLVQPAAVLSDRAREIAKYTMLANAGGLTLALSQDISSG
jgi:hypothetical protein